MMQGVGPAKYMLELLLTPGAKSLGRSEHPFSCVIHAFLESPQSTLLRLQCTSAEVTMARQSWLRPTLNLCHVQQVLRVFIHSAEP